MNYVFCFVLIIGALVFQFPAIYFQNLFISNISVAMASLSFISLLVAMGREFDWFVKDDGGGE